MSRGGPGNGRGREAWQRVRSNTLRAFEIQRDQRRRSTSEVFDSASVNAVLQKEMKGYVSRGLQRSARMVTAEDEANLIRYGYRVIKLLDPSEDRELLTLRVKDFFRLVFGVNLHASTSIARG